MKTVLITGASGFIGSQLTKRYLENGDSVIAVVRSQEKLKRALGQDYNNRNLTVCFADFSTFDRISAQIFQNVDLTYYLAWDGYGKHTNDYSVQISNIKPVCDCMSEVKKLGCKRFLFASSFSEFAKQIDTDATPCNVYGSAKKAAREMAEAVAWQLGVELISVAFANIFGPGDYSDRSTNTFIRRLLDNQAIDLTTGENDYNWYYIDDCINDLMYAGELGISGRLYFIHGITRPLKEIVEELRDIVNPACAINYGVYKDSSYIDFNAL